ncbi:MAG: ATP-binding cassette domain-containing protein [Thermoleophilaceae bacterium]|nr:ATP-binding cassette domain-containing protein [Thermoleophilaceae bacterium]
MIEFNSVTKSFGSQRAIDDITFTCKPGTITGFLGPNGAGKSTSMRVLCGLSRADSGDATIFGRGFAQLENPGREVGVLLDASAQHAGRKGREVLAITALTLGVRPGRVDELLELVGLAGAAEKRVGNYSLGMKQRLGIANALLGDPRALVLDEPANGLDPEGIRWLRGLLREFADAGGTVLLSSHLLKEIDAVADDLVIIAGGKVVSEGTRDELLDGRGTTVKSPDPIGMTRAFESAGIEFRAIDEATWIAESDALSVSRAALDGGVLLTHLDEQGENALEDLFFDLVSDQAAAA